MKRQLPPLHALLAAEAAARLGSFKSAADELNVTPSAVSHNIRALETWLGARLFVRIGRTPVLTAAGAKYLADIGLQLDSLAKRTRKEIASNSSTQPITIQTTDSLANRWLVSRIPDFQAKHSGAGIQIITYEFTEPFRPQDADLAILYGHGEWPQTKSSLLLREAIFPVVGRKHAIRKGRPPLATYLNQLPLLHDDNLGVSWEEWIAFAAPELNGETPSLTHGAHFNHSHLALLAAEQGHGIALASAPLVADAIRHKALFPISTMRMQTDGGYYLVQAADPLNEARIDTLVHWLSALADSEKTEPFRHGKELLQW